MKVPSQKSVKGQFNSQSAQIVEPKGNKKLKVCKSVHFCWVTRKRKKKKATTIPVYTTVSQVRAWQQPSKVY